MTNRSETPPDTETVRRTMEDVREVVWKDIDFRIGIHLKQAQYQQDRARVLMRNAIWLTIATGLLTGINASFYIARLMKH